MNNWHRDISVIQLLYAFYPYPRFPVPIIAAGGAVEQRLPRLFLGLAAVLFNLLQAVICLFSILGQRNVV